MARAEGASGEREHANVNLPASHLAGALLLGVPRLERLVQLPALHRLHRRQRLARPQRKGRAAVVAGVWHACGAFVQAWGGEGVVAALASRVCERRARRRSLFLPECSGVAGLESPP